MLPFYRKHLSLLNLVIYFTSISGSGVSQPPQFWRIYFSGSFLQGNVGFDLCPALFGMIGLLKYDFDASRAKWSFCFKSSINCSSVSAGSMPIAVFCAKLWM
jgi:hypothetical protein